MAKRSQGSILSTGWFSGGPPPPRAASDLICLPMWTLVQIGSSFLSWGRILTLSFDTPWWQRGY